MARIAPASDCGLFYAPDTTIHTSMGAPVMKHRLHVWLWAAAILVPGGCQPDKSPAPSQPKTKSGTPAAAAKIPASAAETKPSAPGRAYAKPADPERLVKTEKWGEVPANLIAVRIEGGDSTAEAVAKSLQGTVVGKIPSRGLYQIETPGRTTADLETALAAAKKLEGVRRAFPLQEIEEQCSEFLKDPVYAGRNADGYRLIDLPDAWTFFKAANALGVVTAPVTVGVVDRAVYIPPDDAAHEFRGVELMTPFPQDRTDKPQLGSDGRSLKYGASTHGTQVSHLIAADETNGGVTGIAALMRRDLKLVHVNHAPSSGRIDPFGAILAVEEAIKRGATVVNMSWGLVNPAPDIRDELRAMVADHPKVLFVAAAGNSRLTLNGTNLAPGSLGLDNLITVGSVTNEGMWDNVSNRPGPGGEVTFAAPGDGAVRDVSPNGTVIRLLGGTSMAAPQVTAAAALMLAIEPKLTAAELKKLLTDTTSPGGMRIERLRVLLAKEDPPPTEAELRAAVKRTQAISPRILNVGAAVAEALKRRLKREGKPPMSPYFLRRFCKIDVEVDGPNPTFDVTVSLPIVGPNGADVEIEGTRASIAGAQKVHVDKRGQKVKWTVGFLGKSSGIVTVTRLDTGARRVIKLDAAGPTYRLARITTQLDWFDGTTKKRLRETDTLPANLPHRREFDKNPVTAMSVSYDGPRELSFRRYARLKRNSRNLPLIPPRLVAVGLKQDAVFRIRARGKVRSLNAKISRGPKRGPIHRVHLRTRVEWSQQGKSELIRGRTGGKNPGEGSTSKFEIMVRGQKQTEILKTSGIDARQAFGGAPVDCLTAQEIGHTRYSKQPIDLPFTQDVNFPSGGGIVTVSNSYFDGKTRRTTPQSETPGAYLLVRLKCWLNNQSTDYSYTVTLVYQRVEK